MEQNILNLDPAKGFWPNMDLDHPDPGLFNQFRRKKIKNNVREKKISLKKVNF